MPFFRTSSSCSCSSAVSANQPSSPASAPLLVRPGEGERRRGENARDVRRAPPDGETPRPTGENARDAGERTRLPAAVADERSSGGGGGERDDDAFAPSIDSSASRSVPRDAERPRTAGDAARCSASISPLSWSESILLIAETRAGRSGAGGGGGRATPSQW